MVGGPPRLGRRVAPVWGGSRTRSAASPTGGRAARLPARVHLSGHGAWPRSGTHARSWRNFDRLVRSPFRPPDASTATARLPRGEGTAVPDPARREGRALRQPRRSLREARYRASCGGFPFFRKAGFEFAQTVTRQRGRKYEPDAHTAASGVRGAHEESPGRMKSPPPTRIYAGGTSNRSTAVTFGPDWTEAKAIRCSLWSHSLISHCCDIRTLRDELYIWRPVLRRHYRPLTRGNPGQARHQLRGSLMDLTKKEVRAPCLIGFPSPLCSER